jgi:phosphoglucosamine mutase
MRFYGRPLSTVAQVMRVTPQRIINVEVASKPPLESLAALTARVAEAETELGEEGRVLIRYSGTQAMCRVMVEGPTQEMTDRLAGRLAEAIRSELGEKTR